MDNSLAATVLAPIDEAMSRAAESLGLSLDAFLKDPRLIPILLHHIIAYGFEVC